MVVLPPLRRLRLPPRAVRMPLVMGIVNVTPDSFSDGGKFLDPHAAIRHGRYLVEQGADWIDVGGESTRPGSTRITAEEELRRVMPVIRGLARAVHVPIAIDTSKADVASAALQAGASIVNDITALHGDPAMARVIARARARVILMHMRGTPQTMQRHPRYHDVVEDVSSFLSEAATRAMASGIARARIFLDPGLGFGKTVTHNLQLLRGLPRLASLGFPMIIGPSRKSFIGKMLDADLHARVPGTLACIAWAQRAGVAAVRVHDVRETVDCLRMLQAIETVKTRTP